MTKYIGTIISALSIVLIAWIVISWGEVLAHNLDGGYAYHRLNFFTVFIECAKLIGKV